MLGCWPTRLRLHLPTLPASAPALPARPCLPQAALQRWVSGTARIPLVGWLSGRAAEILIGVQRYYTYVERMGS